MKRFVATAFFLLSAFAVLAFAQTPDECQRGGDPATGPVQGDAVKTPDQGGGPSYPIAAEVFTTLDRTVVPLPHGSETLMPKQVADYAPNHYGEWDWNGPRFPYLRPDMRTGEVAPSVRDPLAATLVSFFTMSDVHVVDKESPTQCIYFGYENKPGGNSSAYSAVILYTPHVLDAAVQTINALHKKAPLDFGIGLGDAANNTEYNEIRWYIDVLDGKWITPSSGAHIGADTIGYQKPFQAAGLDKSLPWYQAIGNHDQFWMGSAKVDDYLRQIYVGPDVLNIGAQNPPNFDFNTRGFYMGLVDGSTEYGDIIDVGPTSSYIVPPQIVPDVTRRSLLMQEWMSEFLATTSEPVGHGFTQENIQEGLACYHFYPRADVPLKVIVLDDTDKVNCGAAASLDYERFGWLVSELDAGEAAGELMVVCAHIPVRPYAQPGPKVPPYALWPLFSPTSDISEQTLLDKLHTYKNVIMWMSGHIHRNAITPQPSPDGNPENGFWEVETPSLRDFPQQFRRFEIARNSDGNISIFALDVDTAANWVPLSDGSASPAWTSRSYAVATQQIFNNQIGQGPHVDPYSGVYNAELVKQLTPAMRAKLAQVSPVVSSFKIAVKASSPTSPSVNLANTVAGSKPTHYMASESPDFGGARWLPYSVSPPFKLSSTTGAITVFFKVRDGSGKESPTVGATFTDVPQILWVSPPSAMVNTGHGTALEVAYTGGAPVYLQWYEGDGGDTSRPVEGATKALFLTPGIPADTSFWVRASNQFGQADSQSVPVVVWNRYYIPHVVASDEWWSRISMVNAGGLSPFVGAPQTTLANVSAYDSDGALLETKTVDIPPLTLYAADVRDMFSPETLAGDVWLKIETRDDLKGLAEFGTTDLAAQTNLPFLEYPEKFNVFPYVVALDEWYTGITLVNTAVETAEVKLTAFSEAGVKLGERTETLAPNGKFARLVSEVFPAGVSPLAIRSIGVESTQPLVGFELFGSMVDEGLAGLPMGRLEDGPPGGATYRMIYPELPDRAEWYTGITFSNQDVETATATARVYDAAGAELGVETFTLNPRQQVTREAWELFPVEKYADMGYFTLSSPGRIAGFELVLSLYSQFRFDGLDAVQHPHRRLVFPVAPADSFANTSLRLINAAASPTAVSVEAFGADGVSLGSFPATLGARSKLEIDVRAAIPTGGTIAWVLVEGDDLFTASAFILSGDGRRLVTYAGMAVY